MVSSSAEILKNTVVSEEQTKTKHIRCSYIYKHDRWTGYNEKDWSKSAYIKKERFCK